MTNEKELAEEVRESRSALNRLLKPGERRTRPRRGSTYPITAEDRARAIAADPDDPRRAEVGAALAAYQQALNAFWVATIEDDMIEALARSWIKLRGSSAPLAEIRSEVIWVVRRAIPSFDPDRGCSFFSYALRSVTWDLDLWSRRRGLPFEVSEKSAREPIQICSLEEN